MGITSKEIAAQRPMLRMRNGASAACETVCPHVRGTVTQYCSLNFTLTDEEREAIEQMLDEVSGKASAESWVPATLRSLLARLA